MYTLNCPHQIAADASAAGRLSHVPHVYISQTQNDGRTALIYAAVQGHTECARVLLDGGADKDVSDHVRNQRYKLSRLPIFASVRHASFPMLQFYIPIDFQI